MSVYLVWFDSRPYLTKTRLLSYGNLRPEWSIQNSGHNTSVLFSSPKRERLKEVRKLGSLHWCCFYMWYPFGQPERPFVR